MATPDGFTLRPVVNRTVGAISGAKTLGLILHVQAGNNALSGWFNNPAAQASSTWWAGKAGGREQYGNPDADKFWAQSAGNATYHSVETEGYPNEPLTPQQIETVATIYAWGHARYGWPFQLAEKPGDKGLGWHGMGGSAWGGHTGCPGDLRKAQRPAILARAKQIAGATTTPAATKEWFDMPIPDAELDKIADRVWSKMLNRPGNTPVAASSQLGAANVNAWRAVQALRAVDPAKLSAAVAAGIKAAGVTVDVDALARAIVVELGKD